MLAGRAHGKGLDLAARSTECPRWCGDAPAAPFSPTASARSEFTERGEVVIHGTRGRGTILRYEHLRLALRGARHRHRITREARGGSSMLHPVRRSTTRRVRRHRRSRQLQHLEMMGGSSTSLHSAPLHLLVHRELQAPTAARRACLRTTCRLALAPRPGQPDHAHDHSALRSSPAACRSPPRTRRSALAILRAAQDWAHWSTLPDRLNYRA